MNAPHHDWPEAGEDLWRGCSNSWECDEMGHQNVRFYLLRAMEGLTELLARAGLPVRPTADAGVARVVGHHLRMMREIRPGSPTHLRGGFTALQDNEATIAQLLYHTESGEVSASFLAQLEYQRGGMALAWPETVQIPATLLGVPELCLPRGLVKDWEPPCDHDTAVAWGMMLTGRGGIADAACDHNGVFRTENFIALFADSTRILTNAFHSAAAATPGAPTRIGSAGVECRLRYRKYPTAGTRYVVRGGIAELNERNRRVLYCLFDAADGSLLAELQTLELLLDLDARRALRLDADAIHSLQYLILNSALPS